MVTVEVTEGSWNFEVKTQDSTAAERDRSWRRSHVAKIGIWQYSRIGLAATFDAQIRVRKEKGNFQQRNRKAE